MMDILFDARWIGEHGIGRFAREHLRLLPSLIPFRVRRSPCHPLDPVLLGTTLWRKRPKLFFTPGCNAPIGWPGTFVFAVHDLNHLCVPENGSAAKRAYYKYVIRPGCHRAAFVLTVSEYSKREIAAWADLDEEKIVNVSSGVGPPFGVSGRKYDPGHAYLLFVGSRKPHKNLPRVLEAYSVSGVRKDVRLIISGYPDKQTSEKIQRLRLSGDVAFLELATELDVSAVVRGAFGVVFPSLHEGFGLPPLEAMACGVPVVTSNVCSIPEVVGDAGILVDPLDVEAIADGIKRLVYDSPLREELRRKGPLRAKKFTWEETARRTWAVLQMAGARDPEEKLANEFART